MLEAMLGLLAASSRGRWVSRRVRQLAFAYVDSAVEVAGLYKLLKPHLEFVLFDCALPTLCATPADLRRFRDDPQEYVRRAHDPMEDFFDPRAAATSLVADLVRCRSKAVLEPLLGRLAGALDAYAAAPTVDAARRKDGALCALGAISDELQSRAPLQPHVEALLAGHVLPELEGAEPFGQHGLLRCRACWALQRFAEHPGLARPDRAPRVAAAVLRALGDADLPVRVEATSALRHLLASDVGGFDEILRPELPRLLDACFRVMREAASDDVVQALEIVVDRYGKDVAPYAVALAQRLGEAFGAYAAAADDDEEASMAAAQCVEAMAATLASLDDNDDNVYGKVEPHLAPVLARIFEASGDFIEYFENGAYRRAAGPETAPSRDFATRLRIHVAAAAESRAHTPPPRTPRTIRGSEPRRRRDSSLRNIHVAAAAPPRPVRGLSARRKRTCREIPPGRTVERDYPDARGPGRT